MYSVPGVYVREGTFGATPTPLSRHDSTYIFITSSIEHDLEPKYITSLADFTNVFGSSPSSKDIELYFLQNPGVGIWVTSVLPSDLYDLTVGTVVSGTQYSLLINGLNYSVTAEVNDDAATVLTKLSTLVNSSSPDALITDGTVRLTDGTILGTNITVDSVAGNASADVLDAATVMMKVFIRDEQLIPGFIIAPEFYAMASATEHSLLASYAEQCAIVLNGVSLVDPRAVTTSIAEVVAERAALSSPRGHSQYYFPYMVDGKGRNVAPSSVVAAINIKAQRTSYGTPAAGNNLPIAGITALTVKVNYAIQSVLNPLGINAIRFFANKGFIIYGARTLSTSSFYTFTTTRVILNVLSRSLRTAFDDLVLTGLTSGLAFSVSKSTAVSVCELMRLDGSLFGSKPDEAYKVIADTTNNTLTTLDNGQLFVDVIVKPTPVTEVISIRLNRASLGTDLSSTEAISTATVATESVIPPQV